MEAIGVALDREALASWSASSRPRSRGSSRRSIDDVGHEFNLGSPKQLEQVLFFELNLPKGKRTKTGYSTDASVLEDLRPAHPMIDKLLEWRIYTKLRSTYVEALPTLHRRRRPAAHDLPPGRRRDRPAVLVRPEPPEHPDPDRARAAHPARLRRRASPALVLLAADYSQIELRILAHVSGDEHLQGRLRAPGRHPSRDGGAGAPQGPDDITKDERSMAKMVNFGLAYGMSDFGLASRANIPRREAQEFINSLLRGVLRASATT